MRYKNISLKEKKNEILISTYLCHPSMANNELSGPIVIMSLIDYFRSKKLNYGLRFVIIPETIGAISYIHRNLNSQEKMFFVVSMLHVLGLSKLYFY